MKALAIYLLQVIIASGILYAYYHFVLRNKKFHQYNRFYLLGSLVIALLVPFLNIPVYFSASQEQSSTVLRTLRVFYSSHDYTTTSNSTVAVTPGVLINWVNILSAVYILIGLIFFVRIILSLKKVISIIRTYPAEDLEGIHFVKTNEPGTPFSFFRWLFWDNNIELQSGKGQQIFRHEVFHIQQKHTWDLVLMETVTTACWINPFFHLMKKELSTIHEFLADQYAVNDERRWDYAELLLMQALQTRQLLVNPFFNNQIKRRIAMITTSTKPGYQYLTKIMVLPVAAIAIALVAFSYKTKEQKNNSSVISLTNRQTFEDTPKKRAISFSNNQNLLFETDHLTFIPASAEFKSNLKDMLLIVDGERKTYMFLHDHVIKAERTTIYEKDNEEALALYGKDAVNGVAVFENATILPVTQRIFYKVTEPGNKKNDRLTIRDSVSGKIVTDIKIRSKSIVEAHLEGKIQFLQDFSLEVKDLTLKYPDGLIERETPFEPALLIINGERFTPAQAGARFNGAIVRSGTATVIEDNNDDAIGKYGIDARKGVLVINATIVKGSGAPIVLAEDTENMLFQKVEIDAEFPGGLKAWDAFLKKTVDAEIAAKNGAPEKIYTVSVEFVVHTDGTISDIKGISNNGYGMEPEIIKAIEKSPKWLSAIQNGRKVNAYKRINYNFIVTDKSLSTVPRISRSELREPDMHQLLSVKKKDEIVTYTFTIEKEDATIVTSDNKGNYFNNITKKLIDDAKAGFIFTIDEIIVRINGKQQRIPSKVYMLAD